MAGDPPQPSWPALRAGHGCPLCAPRAPIPAARLVCALPVSSVYLWENEAYRGTCSVIYDGAHATRPGELTPGDWAQLCADIRRVETAITDLLAPDHVNVELMGNTVPHLHAWVIPRRVSDPRWGGPIWTTAREEMALVPMAQAASQALAGQLAARIASSDEPPSPPTRA